MKVIAINGGPRKEWNTATLLRHALDGAASNGAETKLIHLYDLSYKGCYSCFACKMIGNTSYGCCAAGDDLKPVLEEIAEADALILGSPVYFSNVTGQMRSFFERLMFPYMKYDANHSSLFKRKLSTAFIVTMNVTEEVLKQRGYDTTFKFFQDTMTHTFGHCEFLTFTDTLQFEDYSKYDAPRFDPVHKKQRREEVFPSDCKKVFDLGARFAEGVQK